MVPTSPVATALLVLNLDSVAQRHLARALADHCRWCKTNGVAVPTALEQLAISVSSGQSRSHQADDVDLVDTGAVKVAYTFSETGQLLGVSESTIRRLVRSHQLRAVSVAGSRRIHREDLETFADALRRQEAS